MYFSENFSNEESSRYIREFNQNGVKLVSFDFFDTLVYRKSITHYKLWKNESWIFFISRFQAEILSRLKNRINGKPEVTGNDIYKYVGFSSKYSLNIEQELEKKNLVKNSTVSAFLAELLENGISVCIISDTHFTEDQIRDFLTYLQIPLVPIFTSSALMKTKSTGLFEEVSSSTDTEYSHWVHIGDNTKSDIQSANSLGISTLRYAGMKEQLVSSGLTSVNGYRFLKNSGVEGQLALSAMFSSNLSLNVNSLNDQSVWSRSFGSLISQTLGNAIISEIHQAQCDNKYDLILYCSRDGWIPYKLHHKAHPEDPVVYFKTSRDMLKDSSFDAYFKKVIGNSKRILIYDLGWRGTTLKYLEAKFPKVSFTGYYWQLLNRPNVNQVQLNPGNLRNRVRIWRSRDFMETIFTDNSNGYDSIGSDLEPIERSNSETYPRKLDLLLGVSAAKENGIFSLSIESASLLLESIVRYPSIQMISNFSDVTHSVAGKKSGKLILSSWSDLFSKDPVMWVFGSNLEGSSSNLNKYIFKSALLIKELIQRFRFLLGRFLKF